MNKNKLRKYQVCAIDHSKLIGTTSYKDIFLNYTFIGENIFRISDTSVKLVLTYGASTIDYTSGRNPGKISIIGYLNMRDYHIHKLIISKGIYIE